MPEVGRGRASGKVILLGEHAVVHGVPAIAVGLDRGATAEVAFASKDQIFFETDCLQSDHELYVALADVRQLLGAPPVTLRLSLQLPAGSGLGASAALGVATVRALFELTCADMPRARVEEASDVWERVFHGNPSGVDRAAAVRGGVLKFTRGAEPEPVSLREPLSLVIGVAGPPANTKLMVESVARLRASNAVQFAKNLAAIHSLVDNALICLRGGDLKSLGKLMDLNHMLLAGWMLSTEEIERSVQVARGAGALGAKLTGSGGGGCIVALAPNQQAATAIESALSSAGTPAFSCLIQAETCNHHH